VERYVPLVAEVAARHGYLVNDIGCYIQPVEDGHACQLQFNFYYDFSDEAEKGKIRGLYAEAAAAAFDMGAYFTRPYHMVAKMVYRENGDYASLLKRLKKQFDPNGVLSPGNICF
jgi:FAD/FMN-containing dehydrogenase